MCIRDSEYPILSIAASCAEGKTVMAVSYTHLRAHETSLHLVCRLLLEKKFVVEIAFDSVDFSKRHKSGVALRFPRIKRLRQDKPIDEVININIFKANFINY